MGSKEVAHLPASPRGTLLIILLLFLPHPALPIVAVHLPAAHARPRAFFTWSCRPRSRRGWDWRAQPVLVLLLIVPYPTLPCPALPCPALSYAHSCGRRARWSGVWHAAT